MSVFYWTIAGYIVVGGGGVGGGRDRRDETQSESYRFVGFRTMYPSAKEFFFVGFNYCKLFCGSDISWHDLPEEPGSSFSFRLVSTLISSEAVSPFQVCFFGAKNMAIPSSTACIESSACIFPDCWRRPPMLLWVCGVCLNFFIFFWETRHMSLGMRLMSLKWWLFLLGWFLQRVAAGPGKMLRKTSSCMFGCGMGLRLLHQQPWQHFSRLGKWRGGTVDSPQKGLILSLRLKGYLVMKRGQSTFIW